MKKSIDERISFLEHCAKLYETSGNSPLTDHEYDKEYAACQKLKPDHPFFLTVGGLDEEHVYGTKFKHKYIMGSLNKDPNPKEFEEWYAKTYPKSDVVAILDLKVDGLSLCCHYEKGKLIRVVTRGDGITGVDVTANAKYIAGIQETINDRGEVEVKGECYKDREDFHKNWSKDVGGDYENPRNFTAGAVNQKDPLVTKERGVSFVAYEVRGKKFALETDKVKFLEGGAFTKMFTKAPEKEED